MLIWIIFGRIFFHFPITKSCHVKKLFLARRKIIFVRILVLKNKIKLVFQFNVNITRCCKMIN